MAKKVLLVAVMAALVAGGAFAQVSLGGGFSMDGGSLGSTEAKATGFKVNTSLDAWNFGGHLFLDVTYAELSFGFLGGPFSTKFTMEEEGDKEDQTIDGSSTAMDISLLGKYPIDLGSMSLFPMLGVGYSAVLSASDKDGKDMFGGGDTKAGDLSNFRLLLGIGGDVTITNNLFFRSSLLGSLRFASKVIDDMTKSMDTMDGGSAKSGLGFGVALKLALGYKF